MNQQDIQNEVKKIKRSFSLRMNGVVSQSMRDKGIGCYLNWGIQFPLLREIASKYGKNYNLAIELWKENVRECKILATLIMPSERMTADLLSIWMEQTQTQEIAEYATFNVYQYVENASLYAFLWIASNKEFEQICGYNLLSCLFKRGCTPCERDINEFVDQAISAISDSSLSVKHAAMNCMLTFAEMGEMQSKIIDSAIEKCI